MKLTVIGASAGVGRLTVLRALQQGHSVTALSRRADTLPNHERLEKISGDATHSAALKLALRETNAIIVSIGTKTKKGTTLFSDTARALIQAYAALGLHVPVLVVTGFGAGESRHYLRFFMRTVIDLFLKDQYRDKTLMEELLTQSALKWEIVRPGRLTNDTALADYRVLTKLSPGMNVSNISRTSVARYLVEEAEKPKAQGQYVALTE